MRGMAWTVALALALILAAGLWCGLYSHRVSEEMLGQIDQLIQAVRAAQWSGATLRAEEMQAAWEEKSAVLALWVNHADIDDVSVGLARLHAALLAREGFHALLYAEELEESTAHLYHRDAFALKNIL